MLAKAVNLPFNTKADEDEPHATSNGLGLYYSITGKKKIDLLLSARSTVQSKWGAGKIPDDFLHTTDGDDKSIFTMPDGRYPQFAFYSTTKDKEKDANFDIYVAVRQGPGKAFSAPTPVQKIATAEDELHPWVTADGKELYFSRKTKDGWRVFVAARSNPAGPQCDAPKLIEELPADFHHATLTPDGKTMYLQGPLEKGRSGIFTSTRTNTGWSKPEPVETLNHPEAPTGDRSPNLTRDGTRLYFASDRPGGQGGLDIWTVEVKDLKKK
jgi:Tol biopolymer transport system component